MPGILAEFSTRGVVEVAALVAAAVIVLAAAWSISRIASSAVENIARQPEAGGRIFNAMLLAGALIEGFTFFALIVCLLSYILG